MDLVPYSGGGGAGGKHVRPRRRGGHGRTPYDRPLEGRHGRNSGGGGDSDGDRSRSWFTKLVSPIATGAGKLLSSLFRREESTDTSTSSSSDEEEDNNSEKEEQDIQEATVLKDGILIAANIQGGEPSSAAKQTSESKLSEIENLLTSKSFTRDEFVHLTALLRSRVVDSSGLKEHGQYTSTEHCGTYLRNEALEEAQRWREERRKAREETGNCGWDIGLCGNISSLVLSTDCPDNAETSPIDIAKAYMGVRPTWASPSPLAFQSYKSRESTSPKNLSIVPTTKETLAISNSQLDDRFRTPASSGTWNRMQSLTHNPYARPGLTQTPYSRAAYLQHSIQQKDSAVESDAPSSSWTQIESSITGGREILKRRSSVIDDGWAHVGPIRRIRQKSFGNVSSFSTPYKAFQSSITDAGSSIPLLSRELEAGQNLSLNKKHADMDKSNSISTSFQVKENAPKICGVPSHLSLTAQKILENIDGTLPLSNEKSAEMQLAFAKDKTSNQLAMSVINSRLQDKDDDRTPQSTSVTVSSQNPGSVVGASAVSDKIEDSQPNIIEGVDNRACGTGENAVALDIQTSKSVSIASDVGINCSQHPTFEFGFQNTTKGPVFSFLTNGTTSLDVSKPKFDFKFESKREMLFSAAVEAAVASKSSSQSASRSSPLPVSQSVSSRSPLSVSQSASAGSIVGLDSNSIPAFSSWTSASLQSISSSPFSSPLFGSSSILFQNTSSSLLSGSATASCASLGSFAFSRPGAFFSASSPFFNLTKSSSQVGTGNLSASGSGSNTSFGLTKSVAFGTGTTQFSSSSSASFSAGSFGPGGSYSFSSGMGSVSTSAVGSSTTFTTSSNTSFGVGSFKSNSTPSLFSASFNSGIASSLGFGISPQFGSGSSANGEIHKAVGVVENVETAIGNSASQTSIATELTSSTSALGTTQIATTLIEGHKNGQMNGKDFKDPSKLSGPLVSLSAEQTSSSTFAPTSVALTVDSQSNAESSEAQPSAPSQNLSASGAQTSFASAGDKESADNGRGRRGRKIVRAKRDRTRRK